MPCTLCSLDLPKNPVKEGEHAFCCSGCLTVFNIIGAQHNYRDHPLFQEALKAGVISNPDWVHEAEKSFVNSETLKFHLQLGGLWCASCADAIRMILMREKGVYNCIVDYATDLAIFTINPRLLSKQHIIEKIVKLGYQAGEVLSHEKKEIAYALIVRLSVALFCSMNIMMCSYPLYAAHFGLSTDGYDSTLGWVSFFLTLPLITFCAWPIWKRLSVSFKSGLFGMETLVFIGVLTAFILSTYNLAHHSTGALYFDSLSMVLSFVLLGKILEKKAKFSAKETYLRLTHYLPKKAYKRLERGKYAYVPLKEVSEGDVLLVRTGEKIILDGVVIEGSGIVDEAVMTGESIPCQKMVDSAVIGGSLVKQGSFHVRVVKDQNESLLGQIVALIEHDLVRKNRTDNLVNQITSYFVPAVLVLAACAFFLFGPQRALSTLLISCPCALGIAAPLAQSRLFFRFAQKGALVRNRNRLAALGENPLFVFDKTGTLTEGKFKVLSGIETLSSQESSVLKALVTQSNHPISLAIADALFRADATQLDRFVEIVSKGVEGIYDGSEYCLGSGKFMHEKGIEVPLDESWATVVYFVKNQTLVSAIHLGDCLRDRLPQLEGVVLSGDAHHLVSQIAKRCGLAWGKGNLDPTQKRDEILQLKKSGRPVIMVGDGVNDAPAMAAADLGISVVSATDLTVEVSDILLTTDHLDALPTLCQLTSKCRRIVYQNLFWAFFYNSIGILLAVLGFLNPLFAAGAMLISSFCVIINSYRI